MICLFLYDEFGKGMGLPSVRDSFEKEPYEGQDKIVEYLKKGTPTMVTSGFATDIVTGERLKEPKYFMTDGKYSWTNTITYYVERYNLRLMKEFEEYVLRMP